MAAALGMIEVYGYTTSIVVADTVAKAADVKVVAIDKNKPANADQVEVPLVMVVKFMGSAGAVESALQVGLTNKRAPLLWQVTFLSVTNLWFQRFLLRWVCLHLLITTAIPHSSANALQAFVKAVKTL